MSENKCNYCRIENIFTFKRIKRIPVEVCGVILNSDIWEKIYSEVNHCIKIGEFILQADLDYEMDEYGFLDLNKKVFYIQTLEDVDSKKLHKAQLNDWLIRGVNGEIYACKPNIFEKTYEVLDE